MPVTNTLTNVQSQTITDTLVDHTRTLVGHTRFASTDMTNMYEEHDQIKHGSGSADDILLKSKEESGRRTMRLTCT
jgi:hypothetical protein